MIQFQNTKNVKMLITSPINYQKHTNSIPENLQTMQNMQTFQPQHEIKLI